MRIPGFRFAGVSAGIKKTGKPDVALLVSSALAAAAGVFTKNQVKAAPVCLSQERIRKGRLRGIVVNSGNANAATGARGLGDAQDMARVAALAAGCDEADFCVASTGVIGVPLPMDRVRDGIALAARELAEDGFERFALAILTTDRGPKIHVVKTRLCGREITLAGCAKGAGMIAPNMATTLAFVATDAALCTKWARALLREEANATFNAVSVDGDTSTNDSLFLLASGASAAPRVTCDDRAGKIFRSALREVLSSLSTMLVRDGEGATHVVRIHVAGAKTERDARAVAYRIAHSPLVKTAIFGADPNWGRILAAVGNAGVRIDPLRIDIDFDDVPVVRRGVFAGHGDTEARAHEVMTRPEYSIRVNLHAGRKASAFTTCDLTREYVSINADYRS
ncbi:MAG: bifunctional glutamate N-acetyltransferase/amino-acid acetyltransferase ArgJ [Deltaproteobacteria bacterium]|nr:bifunctional glutamate N-acetyltransferase/amino-acid acetyltransferase ArgJ [Deltaproteobacteria bacterium]